ncbi:host factor-I protein [Thermotomaculum hydrothermale]|uniref:RNA-binding protein Hfq n=1 Tax=Thermotomaculum hydrothermale TaxID=981385 RepID=A0A7R6PEB4_9BACT|nr:RNA chaperone Hfq [Thermotomaculum hydrothermale]BBB32164.1 host factor-I protein [Thermotomaculum hydrothermale]
MTEKSINIQDDFLNRVRREKLLIHIFLVSGKRLIGKIKSFDKFTILLVNRGVEQLVFKHAIQTILIADKEGMDESGD